MGDNLMTNPVKINFYTEMYEKEFLIRYIWASKNPGMIQRAAIFRRPEKNYTASSIAENVAIAGMDATTRDHLAAGRHKYQTPKCDLDTIQGIKNLRHEYPLDKVGLAEPGKDPYLEKPDTNLNLDPVMKPVSTKVKKILYKAEPHREIYLNKRLELEPEDKYYFPPSSNSVYGWRLCDSRIKRPSKNSSVGQMCLIYKNRTWGPDPPHYNIMQPSGLPTCVD